MRGPVFIVGTGRCGSTMMSELARRHPDLLSASEFFTSLDTEAFVGGPVTGEQMCARLAAPGSLLFRLGVAPEQLRYRSGAGARYQPADLPRLLYLTLPFVSGDPERLLDELLVALRARGMGALADHYRFVLDWLAGRLGKRLWIERSGGSIRYVPVLARFFPDARFVHLYRDGRDAAISMQTHPGFRLQLRYCKGLRGVRLDPFALEHTRGVDPLGPYAEKRMAAAFSVAEFERERADLADMGWMWNGWIERGLDDLRALPPDRVLNVRFEDLTASPREELARFVRWIGPEFDDPEWVDAVCGIPRRTESRWLRLPRDERERLTQACAPGLRRLGYAVDRHE